MFDCTATHSNMSCVLPTAHLLTPEPSTACQVPSQVQFVPNERFVTDMSGCHVYLATAHSTQHLRVLTCYGYRGPTGTLAAI